MGRIFWTIKEINYKKIKISIIMAKKTKQTKIKPNVDTQDDCIKKHAGQAGVCVNGVWIPAG